MKHPRRPVAKAVARRQSLLPQTIPTFLALLGLIALMAAIAFASESGPAEPSTSNPLVNPEGAVDRMVFLDTAADWEAGEATRAMFDVERGAIVLADDRERGFRRNGFWSSEEIEADFPFTEFIPSWNADTPERTGVTFFARVRDAENGEWSPWLFFGEWGHTVTRPTRTVRFDGGVVHTDVLKLDRPADAFQLRARFEAFALGGFEMPSVRRLAVSYSGIIEDDAERERLTKVAEVEGDWARSLPVPFVGQHSAPAEIGGSICSPTSVTMVMAYWGIERPLVENAMAAYDPNYGIFGNWVRSTQLAASHGLDGWVTRMRDYDDVKAWIARGVPVIASIRFREGEFPSAVFNQSGGHLIVVRGFTEEGDVIVNDPASLERGEGAIYNADELANAWFNKGGVAYVVMPQGHFREAAATTELASSNQPAADGE